MREEKVVFVVVFIFNAEFCQQMARETQETENEPNLTKMNESNAISVRPFSLWKVSDLITPHGWMNADEVVTQPNFQKIKKSILAER